MSPSIVIDARSVVAHRSGIGNYVEALVHHLVPAAPELDFLLLRAPGSPPLVEGHSNVRELAFPGETKSVKTVFSLGRAHPCADAALYHSPADLVPLGLAAPFVVTIHDLMWIEARRLASAFLPVRWANGAWYTWNIGRAVRGARRVVAISEATRRAIERVYPEHAHKVRVVHHGVDRARFDPARARERAFIDDLVPPRTSYSLCVGQGSPYKNHPRILRAFVRAVGNREDHKLVLVRRFSRVDDEMNRLLQQPEVRRVVIVLSHVTDAQLITLYRHARMLLFASLYEGFGMPALEAMSVGLPVVGSSAEAVREVTGDAALHPDPKDEEAIAQAIRDLDGRADLREHIMQAGLRRVAEFSWQRCAEQTLGVYREALAAR